MFEKRASVVAGEPLKTLFSIASSEQHMAPMILSVVLEEIGKQDQFVKFIHSAFSNIRLTEISKVPGPSRNR